MQKRLVCLLILVLFAGCAAKSRAASPEAVLAEIAAGRWELDVEASMRVDSAAREEIEKIGRDKFVADYGQLGFSIDTQKRVIAWYAVRSRHPDPFRISSLFFIFFLLQTVANLRICLASDRLPEGTLQTSSYHDCTSNLLLPDCTPDLGKY